LSTPTPPSTTAPPIQVVLRYPPLQRQRVLVFFRVFLLIPHVILLGLWGIPIVFGLPFLWIAALATGQAPDAFHRFYGAYVRYYASVWAYGTYLSDIYPQFDGRPGYSVDVEIPARQRQSRWSILFRLVLALPPLLLATVLVGGGLSGGDVSSSGGVGDGSSVDAASSLSGGVLATIWFLGWFACMAKARMPQGMRDLSVYCIGYGAQAWGYFFLLTPRFPNATPVVARPLPQPPHPVRAQLDDDLRRSRLTVFFRFLLYLPHLVWLVLWGIVVFFAAIVNWLVTLLAGRSPGGLHRFLAAYVRYLTHVNAFVGLVANPFPGFVGAEDSYPFTVHIDPPQRQNRWITGFRLILAVPVFVIASALSGAVTLALIGSWFFALITGRMPRGLRDLQAFTLRYTAQHLSYVLLLTDRYPYSGPTLATAEAGATDPSTPTPPAGWGSAPTAPESRTPQPWEPPPGWLAPAPPPVGPADPPPPPPPPPGTP
jgi:hypothetical protein